jgi:hypothetical protein
VRTSSSRKRSTRLFKRKQGRAYGGGGSSNYKGASSAMEGASNSLLHSDEIVDSGSRVCESAYQRLAAAGLGTGVLGGADLQVDNHHRYALSEQIEDDVVVESTVDLRPNGEVFFVESRGGSSANVRSVTGSWYIDSTTNLINHPQR